MPISLSARLDRLEQIVAVAQVDHRGFLERTIEAAERLLAHELTFPPEERAARAVERDALYRQRAIDSLTEPDLPYGVPGSEKWFNREIQEINRRTGRSLLAGQQQ